MSIDIKQKRKTIEVADLSPQEEWWKKNLLEAYTEIGNLKQQRDDLLETLKRAYFLLEKNKIKDVYFEALRLRLGDLLPSQIVDVKNLIAAIAKCET